MEGSRGGPLTVMSFQEGLGPGAARWFLSWALSLGATYSFFFFKDFIYLFLERGKGREKERERNIDMRKKQ